MISADPVLVLRFLAADPALSADSVEVWAEAAFRAKAIFHDVTIAVVDSGAAPLPDPRVEDLRLAAQTFSVQFRHLRVPSGATFGDVAAELCRTPEDLLLVADPADVPSPWLLERLLAGLAGPDVAVMDAQPLPMTVTERPEGEGDDWAPAGVCVLLSGGTCARLGDFEASSPAADIGRLLAAARDQRLRVAGDRRATVFHDVRVAPDGRPSVTRGHRAASRPSAHQPGPGGGSHPAMLETTSLGEILRASGVQPRLDAGPEPASCFLTVLTRTQGLRPRCLEDLLLCLAAQTVRDFEVVIACHRAPEEAVRATAETVAGLPAWLQARVRIIEVDRPGRAAPLNDALDAANGRYAAILDDDDLVLAHWVETFEELERAAPGRMLRAVALRQDVTAAQVDGELTATAVGPPRLDWPLSFELVDHLNANASPCLSVAFPRGVYGDLGFRFDEGMLAIEDWEYLMRTAALVGVEASPEPTGVYRWWLDGESSRTAQTPVEWAQARARAHETFDNRVILLPRGSVRRIRSLFEDNRRAWAEVRKAGDAHDVTAGRLAEAVTTHAQALAQAVGRAEAAEARVATLQRRLRRQQHRAERRLALLRSRLEEAEAGDGPGPGLLRRLSGRGLRARRGR